MRIALALILMILLSFVVTNVQASDYKSNFRHIPAVDTGPIRVATWKRTPTIIVCKDAPVTESQIKKGVNFWRNLGHKFLRTQYKYDPLNKCNSGAPTGYILVHLVTQNIMRSDNESLAETHFFINNDTDEVDWAIIYMRVTTKDTVLEHEIGHALGYLHFNKMNHLMNAKWIYGGWDTDGLERKRR